MVIRVLSRRFTFSVTMRACVELLCFHCLVQVGGSASVSPNKDGFLHPIWSLRRAQRSLRKLNQTMKASHLCCLLCLFDECCVLTVPCATTGEVHITIKAYKADQEDEISLELGETIEVIHKLLDGWWVVRYRVRFHFGS